MTLRRFQPLARVAAPAAVVRGPGRFRPLALLFRRSRLRPPAAPAPTLVASDGARVTIAPRLHWHLHLHQQHLHQSRDLHQQPGPDLQQYQHRHHARGLHRHRDLKRHWQLHQCSCLRIAQLVRERSPSRASAGAVVHGRATGLDVRRHTPAVGTVRLTSSASPTAGGIERILPPHQSASRSPSPAQTATAGTVIHRAPHPRGAMRPLAPGRPGVAGPSSHAAAASASARIIRGRALVVSSHGSGGQPASALRLPRAGGTVGADTSGPMRPRPDPDRGRALPPPALTARSALAPIANRMAERGRLYPGLRSSRADRPGTSSPSGGPATPTVVQALATRRCDPERPVSPAPITLRRATHAQADRPAPPPARVASAPPPPVRVDIDRLSDEVIRRIERRSRIERERRGLL